MAGVRTSRLILVLNLKCFRSIFGYCVYPPGNKSKTDFPRQLLRMTTKKDLTEFDPGLTQALADATQ